MGDRNAWSFGTRAKLVAVIVAMTGLLALGVWTAWEDPSDTEAWSIMVVAAAGVAIYARVVGALRRSRVTATIVAIYAVLGLLGSAGYWFHVIGHREFRFTLELLLTTYFSLHLMIDTPLIVRDAMSPRRDNATSKDD